MDENFNDRGKTVWLWFIVILIMTYFIWYLGGGPARWDAKFENIEYKYGEEKSPVFLKDFFKKGFQE